MTKNAIRIMLLSINANVQSKELDFCVIKHSFNSIDLTSVSIFLSSSTLLIFFIILSSFKSFNFSNFVSYTFNLFLF